MAQGSFRTSQVQRTEQRQQLLPQMLQSIELLALPGAELEQWLNAAADQNDALRVDPPELRSEPWTPPRRGREASELHDQMLREMPEPEPSLCDVASSQVALAGFDAELEAWVRFLIGCLDARGHLSTSDDELLAFASEAGLAGGAERLARAIAALQRLEPRGIGARGAVEALLLQLDPNEPDYALLCRLLEDFLEDLARHKHAHVARALEIDVEHLELLLARLKTLDLRPAADACEPAARTILPELVVERGSDQQFEVRVESRSLPSVTVSAEAEVAARDTLLGADARRWMRGRVGEARAIATAFEARKATLLRVARAAFVQQTGFLERGPRALVPLSMSSVAESLGLALSTVSRAVAGKHVQTPHGIFALRELFPAESSAAEGASRQDVASALRAVIAAEDVRAPLSDDDLVERLARRGFDMARRTVAKLRSELSIPSSYQRRRSASA